LCIVPSLAGHGTQMDGCLRSAPCLSLLYDYIKLILTQTSFPH
jgi:hypothetical protein